MASFFIFYINWSVSGHFHTCPILGSPPQRPPQSYVRLQRVFGKLETVNLFWCSHVGKPDI